MIIMKNYTVSLASQAIVGGSCYLRLVLAIALIGHGAHVQAAKPDLPDLDTIPADLTVPITSKGRPLPGLRVRQSSPGWESTQVHHTLYLPRDWVVGRTFPVIVEYPGNGNYRNAFGDVSTGRVGDCHLGYGITGGAGFIWIAMPFVLVTEGRKENSVTWWGDVVETKRYCVATIRDVCARFGGDSDRVILCGFSRGAIACNFIGLHDDEIAKLWRGFICHSHYDGVRETWPYVEADRASALARLRRLGGRPQFISHEGSTRQTELYLQSTGIQGRWTFEPIPFRNHSDQWVLRDIPSRQRVREWLHVVCAQP